MWVRNPRMERFIFGFFLLLAFGDGILRFIVLTRTICNTGVAFGIELPQIVLWTALGLLLSLSLWYGRKAADGESRLAWRLVFIGGVVNTVDRFVSGCVHDYLTLPLFPSFNLADMMLFLGVTYLLARMTGIFSTGKTYVG